MRLHSGAHLSLVVGQPLGSGSYKLRLRSTTYSTPALLKTRITGSLGSIIKTGRSNIDELEKPSTGVLVRPIYRLRPLGRGYSYP